MSTELPEAQRLVIRGIEAVEGTKSGLHALEKSVDDMQRVVTNSARTAERAADALDRIAKAEEDRTAEVKEQGTRRMALASRFISSQPVQFLIMLVLAGVAQTLGLRWVVEAMVPKPEVAPTTQTAPLETP